jgi:hypothetical protein
MTSVKYDLHKLISFLFLFIGISFYYFSFLFLFIGISFYYFLYSFVLVYYILT